MLCILLVHDGIERVNGLESLKLPVYERAGVPEVWLIHPTDRTLTMYRFQDGRYGRPTILELKGQIPLTAVPGISIDWDRLLSQLV
jgi:Uma2 family endonuclease